MEIRKDRLIQLMAQNKMSYNDLAQITHVHKSTLQRYFTGTTKKIPIERIWPIAFALNTTPQYIMGDTDNPNPYYQTEKIPELNKIIIHHLKDMDDNQLKAILAFIKMLKQEN